MKAVQRLAATGLLAGVSIVASGNPVSIETAGGPVESGLIVFDSTRGNDNADIVNLSLTASTSGRGGASLAARDGSRLDPSSDLPILDNDTRMATEIEAIALYPDDGTAQAFDDDAVFAIGSSEWTELVAMRSVPRDITTESVPAPLLLALLGIGLALLGLLGRRS